VGALPGGGACCGGWGSWTANWNSGAVVYNHNNFYGNSAWHGGYYNGAYHDGYGYHNAYDRSALENTGYANRAEDWNHDENWNRGLSADRGWNSNSWAHADSAFRSSNAFSGFGNRFGGGGWASRASSFRGWGSMRGGGFSGGRFGGGGFGGGGFHGGFRRLSMVFRWRGGYVAMRSESTNMCQPTDNSPTHFVDILRQVKQNRQIPG